MSYEKGRQRNEAIKMQPPGRQKELKVTLSYEDWTAVYEEAQRDKVSVAEAVRRIVARGLRANG